MNNESGSDSKPNIFSDTKTKSYVQLTMNPRFHPSAFCWTLLPERIILPCCCNCSNKVPRTPVKQIVNYFLDAGASLTPLKDARSNVLCIQQTLSPDPLSWKTFGGWELFAEVRVVLHQLLKYHTVNRCSIYPLNQEFNMGRHYQGSRPKKRISDVQARMGHKLAISYSQDKQQLREIFKNEDRDFLRPGTRRGGVGSERGKKGHKGFFKKCFFQKPHRIILGPPKHVLHLVWSVLGISTAIKQL